LFFDLPGFISASLADLLAIGFCRNNYGYGANNP